MSNLESNIFGKKKFSDLLKEIYDNQKKKEQQITALIGELKPLINDIGDATLIVPLIKEYMELGIKNDEQLVKMAKSTAEIQDKMGKIAFPTKFNLSEEQQKMIASMAEMKGGEYKISMTDEKGEKVEKSINNGPASSTPLASNFGFKVLLVLDSKSK